MAEAILSPVTHKTCSKCQELKTVAEFWKRSDRPGKFTSQCMMCGRIRVAERYKKTDGFKEYRERNRQMLVDSSAAYQKKRRATDSLFSLKGRIRANLGTRIRSLSMSFNFKSTEALGCDWEFLKTHIEKQFLSGMTWENRSEWHIDHIRPLATAKTDEDALALSHFTNLRPMWAKDNRSKGAQVTHLI